jgi:hypothetical protein
VCLIDFKISILFENCVPYVSNIHHPPLLLKIQLVNEWNEKNYRKKDRNDAKQHSSTAVVTKTHSTILAPMNPGQAVVGLSTWQQRSRREW